MSKKKLTILILAAFFISSCAGSVSQHNNTKIAQAMKKEADVFQSHGNYTAALSRLLEAEKIIPRDPYLQNSLGLAYMGKDREDLAITAFKKALSIKPDYIEAINNLGAAYLRQGKWDMAVENFKTVLDNLLYPTPHYPLSNIGWAYLGEKKYHLAETYFMKALDKKPWFTAASHGLAQVYIRTGQMDKALDYLHKCINQSPDTAIFHADIAQAFEGKGMSHQAMESWEKVLKLVPERSSLAKQAETRLLELR